MFYQFMQNNSGGSFSFDEAAGVTHIVIVEADDYESANAKAQDIGLYWNGVDEGMDCPCCGDRWYPQWKDDGDKKPLVYGMSPKKYVAMADQSVVDKENAKARAKGSEAKHFKTFLWMAKGKEICVHYKNGRRAWF